MQLDSTHSHLVHKQKLNHLAKLATWLNGLSVLSVLAKWLSVGLWTKWLWVQVQLQSLKFQISRLVPVRRSLTFRHLQSCGFPLKHVRDTMRTHSQMHRTDKYSQHSSIILPVWLNDWVFVYDLSGCGFESSCSHLNFTFRTWFEQGISWHSGNYKVWIHSETCTWHDKNIQSKTNHQNYCKLKLPSFPKLPPHYYTTDGCWIIHLVSTQKLTFLSRRYAHVYIHFRGYEIRGKFCVRIEWMVLQKIPLKVPRIFVKIINILAKKA